MPTKTTKPKSSGKPEYTSINQVNPRHRHMSGQPLSLDYINQIDQAANSSSEPFCDAFYAARQAFAASHSYTDGVWSKN